MRKLCRVIFSRYFISAAIILLDLALLFYLATFAYHYSVYALTLILAINALTAISIVNRNANPEYKVSWLVVVMFLPIFGALLYVLFYSYLAPKQSTRFMRRVRENLDTGACLCESCDEVVTALREIDPHAAGKALEIMSEDELSAVYTGSESRYFGLGEEMYECMLSDISAAKKYIFLEYFIIEDGVMWGSIHELLARKAEEGVEVRVLYDDIGCMKTLPSHYNKRLSSEGIRCLRFSPVSPRVTAVHNNRDHRKLLIVDGEVGYTGGINLADEYINKRERFGHWKDGGVRISGCAVEGLLKLFLSAWDMTARTLTDAEQYINGVKPARESDGGYYIPFGSGPAPIYPRPVGKNLLLNIINQAKDYVYITTPYLIIDYDLTESLRSAARRGVDVRIVTPKRADKRLVKLMTKNSYPYLMDGGVRIFEYEPGFIHEKTVISDDTYAMIGTINLDYRSLAHHYEDAVLIYGSPTVLRAKEEFLQTLSVSREQEAGAARLKPIEALIRNLVRIFAPLL